MKRRIPTKLEQEIAKWPAPPGKGDPIRLATAIAGKCWHVVVSQEREDYNDQAKGNLQNRIDMANSTIYVTATKLRWKLPKLIALAHRLTCIERTDSFEAAMNELVASLKV